jgi:nucleoside-diphosphate-sugar epimerase
MIPETFKNRKILVVGGAGFVGSNLTLKLLEDDPAEVLVIDNLLSSEASNVPVGNNLRFVYGSITDDAILHALPDDLDYVFHLACYHGNQSSIANPLADHENNTLTSLKLFERLKDIKHLQKVVYAAAGCAVAEKTYENAVATDENAPVSLFHDSPYSISKLIGEMYGNYYWNRYALPFVKARFQNVYGPMEILGAGIWRGTQHTVWRNVIPTFIWKALHQKALPVENGGKGSRDFIFVEDIVKGLIACAKNGEVGEVYNLASGRETSIIDLANLINKFTRNSTPIDLKPAREWDNSGRRFGETTKAYVKLGFSVKVSIREGIERTVNWTKQNKKIIQKSIEKHSFSMKEINEKFTS